MSATKPVQEPDVQLEPIAARMAVNALVRQTGSPAARLMRVAAIKAGSAHCEWVHEGRWYADWFCVSGLRVTVCSDVRLTRSTITNDGGGGVTTPSASYPDEREGAAT